MNVYKYFIMFQLVHHTDNTHYLHAGLQITILIPLLSIHKNQTIRTPTVFNNYPFSTCILNNFNQNYIILIIVE